MHSKRTKACRASCCHRHLTKAHPWRAVKDECFAGEMLQQERACVFAPRQCVRTGQCHEHRLLKQPVDDEPFLIGMGDSDEGNINLFASQQFQKVSTEPFFQSHGYQWIGFSKRTNGLRDQWMKGTRGHNPYADPALLASRRAPSCFKCVIELGKDSARIDKEGAPGIGQLNTACSSVE